MRSGAVIFAAVAACVCGTISLAQDAQQESAPPAESPSQSPPPQSPKDAMSAMIGAWEFSNADHDKVCRFNFRADAVSGGNKIDIDKNCPNVFPSTKGIVAWALDNYGSLRLLDAHGNSVVDLTEVESGMYDGFTPEEGRYILQTAAAAAPMRSTNDMIGDWGITRGAGRAICVLTLASSPAGSDTLALKVKPGCDASITRFAPVAWRLDQGDLVLLSQRGESWQFEANDTNTWQRVPESADPFLLIRQ